ncbi:TPA: hypothetical protein DIC40_07060 [Patescibacteria group bacterium]|nr:hypothetical protein P148_SR1C00001G0012 [candidate division SR1 bacterium RAAC1_SR1_1]HCY21554.1 hypothetical protein [Candidatus Gracilibacteria bacterium]
MLTTLSQAKTFVHEKIAEYLPLENIEKDILDTLLEETFFAKIENIVSEQDIENQHFEKEEDLDAYLFHKIQNYTTLLEEATAETITDYIINDQDSEENDLPPSTNE